MKNARKKAEDKKIKTIIRNEAEKWMGRVYNSVEEVNKKMGAVQATIIESTDTIVGAVVH